MSKERLALGEFPQGFGESAYRDNGHERIVHTTCLQGVKVALAHWQIQRP